MTPDVDWTNSSRDLSDNLDDHSIEELSDYLDSGPTPRNRSIEASPGCHSALQAMERLRDLAGQLAWPTPRPGRHLALAGPSSTSDLTSSS